MFADDVSVNGVRIDMDDVTDDLLEACRVEHGPGPDDTCGRQPGNLGHSLGEDVDRVADDDNRAASAGESLADIADQGCIVAEQVQPGFAGSTASAGGNDDNVSVDHILDGGCPDQGGRVERGSMRQVHGFTLGDCFAHIVQEQFV